VMEFSLIPADDPVISPDDDLAAAVAGALAVPTTTVPVPPPAPVPFGATWLFDFETGQFVQRGSSPVPVSGFAALEQWCLMAIQSVRYAHPVFSDDFGREEPEESLIGELAAGEALADWQAALVEALLVHERITSIEDFTMTWDPSTGVLYIESFTVVTDTDESVTVSDVTLRAGGDQQ
jgi:hypothetical protein